MKTLLIDYTMKLEFSDFVNDHYFLLRCVPVSRGSQTVTSRELKIEPSVPLNSFSDVFGNVSYQGYAGDNHKEFSFHSKAVVSVDSISGNREPCKPLYKYSTALTFCSDEMKEFLYETLENTKYIEEIKSKRIRRVDTKKIVEILRKAVHNKIEYAPNSTNVKTSASDSFKNKKGVCQDYAHILCSLCRECGIPARYIAGTSKGEGSTHAWVEFFVPDEMYLKNDGTEVSGKWFGVDPTRDKFTDDNYVILAVGRDFSDCKVDVGIFRGNADQLMTIFVKTTEIEMPKAQSDEPRKRRFLTIDELKNQQQQE